MAVVPASHTFAAGVATTSEANTYIRDPIAFLLTPPTCRLRQTVSQNLTNTTNTPITFDVEDLDSVNGHSTVTNTSRYTAVYAGWYQVSGGLGFAMNATGTRHLDWSVNAAPVNGSSANTPGNGVATARVAARTMHVYLNVGDYLEMIGWQSSGGILATAVVTTEQPSMDLRWVSN